MPLDDLQSLTQAVTTLREHLTHTCEHYPFKPELHPDHRQSAHNLISYLALRQQDLRPLQSQLSEQGLSSLGLTEAHVLASVDAVLKVLCQLSGTPYTASGNAGVSFRDGEALLERNVLKLLGNKNASGSHIMVTMPSEAAHNGALIDALLQNGMTCMRINCAHDGPPEWQAMIDHLRKAQAKHDLPCKISMDLGGPKLRTTRLPRFTEPVKVKPRRNDFGEVVAAARILFIKGDAATGTEDDADLRLCVPPAQWEQLQSSDRLTLIDCRGAKRYIEIVACTESRCLATLTKTAYVSHESRLQCERDGSAIGELTQLSRPAMDAIITLHPGDHFTLAANPDPGQERELGCSLPELLSQIAPGASVWFDDGKIGTRVTRAETDRLYLEVVHAAPNGTKLRADKGINFPDSQLILPALTDKDLLDLDFVATHADIVALSFANTVSDVNALCQQLRERGRASVSVVLKIETAAGFRNLAPMLLAAMTLESCGIMIARGDLAIEVGFERLAEVQEEMLWICQAAHVPVIWATQVLETMAKSGAPTRAEISDAALSHKADCVMLNKGEHIVEALRTLHAILTRMDAHEHKRLTRLRPLSIASNL